MADDKHFNLDNDWRNMLYTETRRTGGDPSHLFEILEGIMEERAWEYLKGEDGEPVGSLQRLIEAPLPTGCGMPVSRLRQLLAIEHRHEGKSQEWRDRMRALRIAIDKELPELGKVGSNQYSTLDSNVLKRGDSADYKLARLKRDAPELAEKAIEGDLSITEAYVQAGLAPKRRAVNMEDAQSALGTLTGQMRPDVLHELIDLLNEWRDNQ